MADLLLVDFALIPGPVRKERQFSLPDDFSGLDFIIPSRTNHSASGFRALFRVFPTRTDRPLFGDPQSFLHDEDRARNFNVFALRSKSRRLLAAVMLKERSVLELWLFWLVKGP